MFIKRFLRTLSKIVLLSSIGLLMIILKKEMNIKESFTTSNLTNSGSNTFKIPGQKPSMKEKEIEYESRRFRIRQVCQAHDLGEPHFDNKTTETIKHRVIFNINSKLTFCWQRKIASTSWNMIFYHLNGLKVKESLAHHAAQRFMPTSAAVPRVLGPEFLKFLFVRHPFSRLVSAYRDKLESASYQDYVFRNFNHDIVMTNYELGGYDQHDFSNFNKTQKNRWLQKHIRYARPTFREFFFYLNNTSSKYYNDHWRPYYLHCMVCNVNYDVIGLYETIDDDSNFIFKKSNLSENLPWINYSRHGSENRIVSSYLSLLSSTEIFNLYNIYKIDFVMFNYDPFTFVPESIVDEYAMLIKKISV